LFVSPKCFLIAISFCWPMKPCQQPRDCVYCRIRVVLGHVPAHDRRRVAGDVEAGLKRFCRRMRAAYSGLMSFQVSPARLQTSPTVLISCW
jgi:hypothetical protein